MVHSLRFGISLMIAMVALPLDATGARAVYRPQNVGWSRLELEASKFFITARSEVELAARPSAEAAADLIVPGEGQGLRPRGAQSHRIDIRTRFLGRDSRVRFWFDSRNARALQRSSHDLAKSRLRHRTYRYTRGGVFSHTLRPGDGEEDRPYAQWTDVRDKYFVFPRGKDAGPAVTEAAGLLYLVPAGDFRAPGDEARVRVFTRGKVREVDVRVAARERTRVDYVEVSGDRERQVQGEVDALRIALRPRVEAGEERSGFKLLGLEGDIDLYLEPRTRALLLVTGKIQIAGRVNLRLRRAVLR